MVSVVTGLTVQAAWFSLNGAGDHMKLSTALTITGFCLVALVAEALLAYMVYSNYAFSLAGEGLYNTPEAYSTGPMALSMKIFYFIFGLTAAIGVAAPVFWAFSLMFRSGPSEPPPGETPPDPT